jgi:hypothetical protein
LNVFFPFGNRTRQCPNQFLFLTPSGAIGQLVETMPVDDDADLSLGGWMF